MFRKVFFIAVATALVASLGLSAASAQEDVNVLRVAATANITTWDPSLSFSTEALYMANMYELLLYVNPPGSEERFRPGLAESWDVSEDGLTWTFHLREGVTFHDGEPLTAEAVKLSIERAQAIGGASFIWAPLDSIDVIDDLTVQFNLSYPAPLDLIAASLYGAWIVSPAAIAAAEEDPEYFESGVDAGTGPYVLDDWTPDTEVVLRRYDDYWGGWDDAPHYDYIVVSIVPEAQIQQQMLEGGEVDLALSLPLENIDQFRDREGYTFYAEPSFYNYVGFLNTRRPPLDDVRVRQAISYAIPYDEIIEVGAWGYATQSRGPVPAGVWPYSEEVRQYHQDLDRARELLAEAGYPDGGFSLVLTHAAENQTEARFAPLIAEALGELGIEVEIRPMLWTQQWEWAKGNPEEAQDIFLLLYWPTYSDAGTDNLYTMFHSEDTPFFNLGYYNNPEYDALIEEAAMLTVTDPERAQELYIQAMNMLVDDAPALFLFDAQAVFVVPDTIEGFQYNPNYPFTMNFYALHPAQSE